MTFSWNLLISWISALGAIDYSVKKISIEMLIWTYSSKLIPRILKIKYKVSIYKKNQEEKKF